MLHHRRSKLAEAGLSMFTSEGPEDPGSAIGGSRVGAELRAARQRLGWNLPDVAAGLRIKLSYLEAIEDGRIAELPGNAYAVGFLRTYATALGLDANEVARRFRAEAQDVNRKPALTFPAPVPDRGVPAMAVVLVGVLLAGGAYVAWYRLSGDRRTPVETVSPVPDRLTPLAERNAPPSNPSPQIASILPQPSPGAQPVPGPGAPAGGPTSSAAPASPAAPPVPLPVPLATTPAQPPAPEARLVLRVKADSWIQVRERQGAVLLNRVMRSGETWPVPDKPQLLMTTGNAGGTELLVDGKPGPALGKDGAVRKDVMLDADALRQGRVAAAVR